MSRPLQLRLPFVQGDPAAPSPTAADFVDAAVWKRRVHETTAAYLASAREHWPEARLRFPRIDFRLRGRSAGEACAETWTTNYNLPLLARYGEAFLAEIVPHELAHLVVAALHPDRVKPHGPEWRAVMALFGVRARATHDFETVPARRVGRVPYRCACDRPHLLTPRAHRRIRRGLREYTCRSCRQTLVWTGRGA